MKQTGTHNIQAYLSCQELRLFDQSEVFLRHNRAYEHRIRGSSLIRDFRAQLSWLVNQDVYYMLEL